jgi:CRP-like cAMP-binding protein
MSRDPSSVWPKGTLLASLPSTQRDDLLALGQSREFPAGSRLLCQGDVTTHVLVLLSGCVKVTVDSCEGQQALLAVRIGGDIVGELAGFDGSPRLATVTAAGLVRARVVDHAAFLEFLRRHPSAWAAVSASVAAKLRWSTRRRVDFGVYTVLVRLARVILELGRQYGHHDGDGIQVGAQLTQPEWAALIGASEPAVHRSLSDLRRQGVVRTGYRRTVILRPELLAQIAEVNGSETLT